MLMVGGLWIYWCSINQDILLAYWEHNNSWRRYCWSGKSWGHWDIAWEWCLKRNTLNSSSLMETEFMEMRPFGTSLWRKAFLPFWRLYREACKLSIRKKCWGSSNTVFGERSFALNDSMISPSASVIYFEDESLMHWNSRMFSSTFEPILLSTHSDASSPARKRKPKARTTNPHLMTECSCFRCRQDGRFLAHFLHRLISFDHFHRSGVCIPSMMEHEAWNE